MLLNQLQQLSVQTCGVRDVGMRETTPDNGPLDGSGHGPPMGWRRETASNKQQSINNKKMQQQKSIDINKERKKRKEERNEGRKELRKEGTKEGRRAGRKEGRKEGWLSVAFWTNERARA